MITAKLLNCVPHILTVLISPVSVVMVGASVFKKSFKCHKVTCETFFSFEALIFNLGPTKPPGSFFTRTQNTEFISTLVLNYDKAVLCVDFNIHVDDSTNSSLSFKISQILLPSNKM